MKLSLIFVLLLLFLLKVSSKEIVMVGGNSFGKFGIGTTTTYTTPQKTNLFYNSQVTFT
jgi:hypothetical protein